MLRATRHSHRTAHCDADYGRFENVVCILYFVLVGPKQVELRHKTPNLAGVSMALALGSLLTLAAGCSANNAGLATAAPTEATISEAPAINALRDSDVPALPFPDNPDPNACGIPAPFGGGAAWLNGVYQGTVIEPTVFLYDSHERLHIIGAVPSGSEVQVQLYQSNPVLDFYYVQADTLAGPQKGWVPAPFLQFTPPTS